MDKSACRLDPDTLREYMFALLGTGGFTAEGNFKLHHIPRQAARYNAKPLCVDIGSIYLHSGNFLRFLDLS